MQEGTRPSERWAGTCGQKKKMISFDFILDFIEKQVYISIKRLIKPYGGMSTMKSVKDRILAIIDRKKRGWIFSAQDFMPEFKRYEIDTTLKTLADEGTIRKICRGIYDYPAYSELLNQPTAPDLYGVAKTFAAKFRWQIYPSGDAALNYFGLSTQIPAKLVFISNGPSRTLETGYGTIYFKHSALRETSFRYMESGLVVQALREIGQANITEDISMRIKGKFNEKLLNKVRHDLIPAANWIQQAIN